MPVQSWKPLHSSECGRWQIKWATNFIQPALHSNLHVCFPRRLSSCISLNCIKSSREHLDEAPSACLHLNTFLFVLSTQIIFILSIPWWLWILLPCLPPWWAASRMRRSRSSALAQCHYVKFLAHILPWYFGVVSGGNVKCVMHASK